MELIIVTGMSGAGKSTAMNALEDIGYYCIDNIPPILIANLTELSSKQDLFPQRVAVGIDVRGGVVFDELWEMLDLMKESNISYKMLFLEASTEALITRYKETRRRHPLLQTYNISFDELFLKEREILSRAREIADFIIDTTALSTRQLKDWVTDIFEKSSFKNMVIEFVSFGFKYGIPLGADLVFDVRCLPNPFYDETMRPLTGLDEKVRNYVFSFPETNKLVDKLIDLINFLLPMYVKEGKSQLEIAIGCTGGKHRSVAIAEKLAKSVDQTVGDIYTVHRDKDKLKTH